MRVVIDARYAGVRPSGIGRYTEALLRHVPLPLTAWLHPNVAGRFAGPGLTAVPVARRPNHLPTLWWPERLGPLHDADVFHAPFNIVARNLPCPVVVTVHDLMWLHSPHLCQSNRWRRWVQTRFFQAGLRNALVSATRIVCPSQATADEIAAVHPPAGARTVVIRHGVASTFRPLSDEAEVVGHLALLGIDEPFTLVVGQNAPYKNHDAIEQAWEASGASGILVMVERLGGPRRRRRRGATLRLGGVSEAQLVALLQAARMMVQFSRCEGFGMPALEALACGTPLIVSDIPALREITGPAAVHVPLDGAALADAMRSLWNDRAWRDDLSAIGPEWARPRTWRASARAHAELYRSVAGRRVTASPAAPRLRARTRSDSEHPAPP